MLGSGDLTISESKPPAPPPQTLRICVGTWNLQGMLPSQSSLQLFIDAMLQVPEPPDLLCIFSQECQRSICMSFCCEDKKQWQNMVRQACSGYVLVETAAMNALSLVILVKEDLHNYYSTQDIAYLKAGPCNAMANKGAISISLNLFGQHLQFINCHLEAHQHQCDRRNQVLIRILNEMVEKDYRYQVFLGGDLNYRIAMEHSEYKKFVGTRSNTEQTINYSSLWKNQQMSNQKMLQNLFFPFYKESQISFPPTYKLSQSSRNYNMSKVPGWTDRIFHRKGRCRQVDYKCVYDANGSDHRPVFANFQVKTEELPESNQNVVRVKHRRFNCAIM